MKNTFLGLTMLFFAFQSNAQQITWQCSDVEVDNAPAFVTVWDQFMNSALGKQMTPHAVFEYVNTNSTNSATHQLCWFSDDPAKLEANQGIFGSAKFMELFPVVNTYINNVTEISNYMGQSLIADPGDFNLRFSVLYGINVQDPLSYAGAFTKMKAAFDKRESTGTIELHEIIAGGEQDITHVVIVRAPSMAEWLSGRNEFIQTKAFQEFAAATRPYTDVIQTTSGRPLQFYNVQ